ncbi:MAG TPA: type VI secretion system baseplate subunit TssE [Gemmataceae bacterium]|nr:type VI secretion system baseplate subunit TssE [Gemmataceae bacterium]
MPPRSEQPLLPSVLDRLLDDDPDVSREAPRSRDQVLRDIKESVRRDIENLLNTRRRLFTWPSEMRELDRSMVGYGIPDLAAGALGSDEARDRFCRMLQTMLRQYEPRFKSIEVRPLANAEPLDRTLRFRIDALLRVDPAPEPVAFDSMLEPGAGGFAVSGVRG